MKRKEGIFQMKMSQRLQFVCTVTAEAHVTEQQDYFW